MRASVTSISKKFISTFFAATLALGLVPAAAFAVDDPAKDEVSSSVVSNEAIEDGTGDAAVSADESGSEALADSSVNDEALTTAADGGAATIPAGEIINQSMPLEVVAKAESTRSYFLAQTLESTRTVPMVSANLPLDTSAPVESAAAAEGDGEATEEDGEDSDESDRTGVIAADSIVVGSFDYRGITYAVEPGGDSVAVVAADHAKLPADFTEAGIIVLPSQVSADGIDVYSVTRIADEAFASLKQADPAVGAPALSAVQTLGSEDAEEGLSVRFSADATSDDGNDEEASPEEASLIDDVDGIIAITVPASITTIEADAFAGAETLRYIIVSADNPTYSMYDGCLYDKPMTSLLLIPEGRTGAVRIAPNVTSFDPEVFSHCPSDVVLVADADSAAFIALADVDIKNGNNEPIEVVTETDDAPLSASYSGVVEVEVGDTIGLASDKGEDMRHAFSGDCITMIDETPKAIASGMVEFAALINSDEGMGFDIVTVVIAAIEADISDITADSIADNETIIDELNNMVSAEGIAFYPSAEQEKDYFEQDVSDGNQDADKTSCLTDPIEADFLVDGIPMIKRTISLETGEVAEYYTSALTYAAEGTPLRTKSYTGAYMRFTTTLGGGHFINTKPNGFTGTVSWTAPDLSEHPYDQMTTDEKAEVLATSETEPMQGSTVSVYVAPRGYVPGGNIGTLEQFLDWGLRYYGASSQDRIVGFRNLDTGDTITPETLYSGNSFTFSYKITVPTSDRIRVTDTHVEWATDPSRFKPIYEHIDDSVAIRFDLNGGVMRNTVFDETDKYQTPVVYSTVGGALQTPQSPIEKEGEVFAGWTTTQNGSTFVPDIAPERLPDLENGTHQYTTYYALWTNTNAETYFYVRYDSNVAVGSTEVTGDTPRSIMQISENSKLAANGYSRHGYRFKEWNSRANGTGASYTQGATITPGQISAAGGSVVTLYAIWEPLDVAVKWESNGGSAVAQTTIKYDQALSVKYSNMPATTKTAYDFGGWYGASDFSDTAVTTAATVCPADSLEMTYYAKWTPTNYTITLNPTDGSLANGQTATISYNIESADFALPITSTRTGYDFAKWNVSGTAPSGTGLAYSNGEKTATVKTGTYGDFTVAAAWSAHTYKATFDLALDGAAWKTSEAPAAGAYDAIAYDGSITFPKAPVKAGWIFKYWAPEDADTTATSSAAGRYEADTSYAKANFKSDQGAVATFKAHWVKNLSAEVPVGSRSVDMDITADWPHNDFVVESENAIAALQNNSDGTLEVISVGEDATDTTALAVRQANAKEAFGAANRGEDAIKGVSLVLTPQGASGSPAKFALFGKKSFGDADTKWTLGPKSTLNIAYDMEFDKSKVDLADLKIGIEPAKRTIASIVYTVALVDDAVHTCKACA